MALAASPASPAAPASYPLTGAARGLPLGVPLEGGWRATGRTDWWMPLSLAELEDALAGLDVELRLVRVGDS